VRLRTRLAGLVASVALLAGMVAADPGPARARSSTVAPEPLEPIKGAVKRLKKALRTPDCQLRGQVLLHSSNRVHPTTPGAAVVPTTAFSAQECADIAAFAGRLHDFKPKRWNELGTAAIVDGKLDGQPFTVTFVLDVDGRFRAVGAAPMPAQIGTTATLDYATSAQAFVTAIATGSCLASWVYLAADSPYVTSRLDTGGATQWCADVAASVATGSGRLFDLASATSPPELLGSTLDLAFFGVDLPSGRYVTLVMVSQPTGVTDHLTPGVFDYVTSRAPTP
jgi:hypothetical protein